MQTDRLTNRTAWPRRPFVLALLFAVLASNAPAQKQVESSPPAALTPEQAAKEGRTLVDQLLAQRPAQNTTNTGVMTIRSKNHRRQVPIRFEVFNTETNWVSRYQGGNMDALVIHNDAHPNEYQLRQPNGTITVLSGNQILMPFAGSDFWLADLGLEFFHWPEQHLIKKEMKRSRSCKVLESTNPNPSPAGYSRVVSWIDNESGGIVMAQAYDAHGKLLKDFIPKKFEKVNGQWQLEQMEIDNDQTDSSTRVDFDVNK